MTTKPKKREPQAMWAVKEPNGKIISVERSRRLARDFAGDMDTPCRVVRVLVREV